jgi:hypothetical protein
VVLNLELAFDITPYYNYYQAKRLPQQLQQAF